MTSQAYAERTRECDWASVYRELQSALGAYGVERAFGEGDFFIVDDDYGSHQHKIECTSPTFFSQAVVLITQKVLSKFPPQWEVIFVATGGSTGSPSYIVGSDKCTLVT